jgi:autotransporter-associated beta strand protein
MRYHIGIAGRLALACLVALTTTISFAADRTWSGASDNNNWTTPQNWVGGVAPLANDSLIFDSFARLTPNNNFATGTEFDGITFAATAGPFVLGGNSITLGGNITDNTPILTQTVNLPLILGLSPNVTVADSAFLTLGGVISGGFGINKLGDGTLTLSAANTFTGPVNIGDGTLQVSSDGNLGAAPGAATPGRIVINDGGTLQSTASFTLNANRGIAIGPNANSGSGTFNVNSGTTLTYGGIIANNPAGTGGLTKIRFGGLTLSGANTYSGPTAVRNGSLTLNFADPAATTPITNIINPSSTLILGGATAGLGQNNNATLAMTGKDGATNVQTFANTNIDIYGAVINVTNGAGGTATLNLGALTHTLGGTVVIPTGAANGAVNTTTTVATTNGILGGWAVAGNPDVQRGITMGTAYATVDGTGRIVPYTAHVAAPAYVVGDNNTLIRNDAGILANADKNVLFTGSATSTLLRVDVENAGTTTDINTLAYTTGGANHTLVIGTGNTLRLGRFGGIFKQANGNNQLYIGGSADATMTGNGTASSTTPAQVGFLTAGGPTLGTPGEIVLTTNETANNNGTLNIMASIVDNGPGGAVTVIKTSVSSVKIDGHNTYSGGTFINQGRFQLAGSEVGRIPNPAGGGDLTVGNPDGLGTGPVTVAPGGYLFISGVNGSAVYTGPNAIPGARANTAQNAPIPNNLTISGIGTNQEPIGAIRLGGKSILTGQITLGGDARIAGASQNQANFDRSYDTFPAINPDGTTLYSDPSHVISGKITGPFNLDIGSAVSITTNFKLSNPANDWTGNTSFANGGGNTVLRLGANDVVPDGTGKGNLVWGSLVSNATNLATLDLNGFNETVNGLSSTTTNLGGVFIQNDGFTATVVPTPTPERPDLKDYAFTAGTSMLTVGGFDQTASFSGVIRDSGTTRAVSRGDNGAVQGLPNPNYNPIDGIDPEGDAEVLSYTAPWATAGAKVALTKIGTGIQTLGGINTYTGGTTINAGTLSITGSLDAAQPVAINTGGTLSGAGDGFTTGVVGNVTMAAGGGIAPGESSALGSVGALTMSSLTVNGGSLRFNLVNPAASDQIKVNGAVNFTAASTITPNGGSAGIYTVLTSTSPITYGAVPTLTPFVDPLTRPATYALDTASDPTAIKLNVTGGSKALTWTGAAVSGNWDINTTTNWTDGAIAEKFFNNDSVLFTDGPTNRAVNVIGSVLPGALEVNNSFGTDYSFTGAGGVGGSVGLLKNGGGKLTVSNPNTYSGTTTINAGTVELTDTGSLGSGTILNGGLLDINRSTVTTISNVIDGPGEVRHLGPGTTTLSAVNTYLGQTTINNGTVVVTNAAGGNSSLGSLFGGQVTINAGGAIDLAGNAGGNLNFGSKQFVIADTGAGGNGAITHSGTAAQLNAFQQVRLAANASIGGTGRFDIRGVGSSLDLANFTLTKNGTNQFTVVGTFVSDGNIVVNGGVFAIETVSTIEDFANTDTTITYNAGTTAQFFNLSGTVTRPMIFNGGNRIGNASADPSTVGSNMTLNGNVEFTSLNNSTGDLTLNGNISETGGPRSVTKTGPATLFLNGAVNYTGTTDIQAGRIYVTPTGGSLTTNNAVTVATGATLQTEGAVVVGAIGGGGTTHVLANGTLTADHIRQGSLIVNAAPAKATIRPNGGNAGTSAVGTIEVDSGAILDLTNNDLIIRATADTKNTVHAAAQSDIVSAQNGPDESFITKWDGPGLTSTSARTANVNASFDLTALGVIRNSDLDVTTGVPGSTFANFSGIAVTPDDVLVKYTYTGDGNLDGAVTFDDYAAMDSAFFGLIPNLGWATGDINFDGAITFDDYSVVDQAFFFQGAPLAGEGSGVAAVPEPGSWLLAGLGALAGLIAWCRRQRM